MITLRRSACLFSLALFAFTGCDSAVAPTTPTPTPAPATAPAPAKTEAKAAAVEDKLTDEEIAEIKKLPADDQKLALEQKICPVSEGHLGDPGMGAPIKVTAEGKTFFLCCAGCKGDVTKDPKKVIAKLEELKKGK